MDISKLDGVEEDILNILCEDNAVQYVESERAKAIAAEVRKRLDTLEIIVSSHNSYDESSNGDDVEEVNAASYD